MKVAKLCLLFFLANMVFPGCSNSFDSSEELNEYLKTEDSGLSKIKNIGEVTLAVTYRPTDLLVAQETRGENNILPAQINNLRNKYETQLYFILSLSAQGREIEAYGNDQTDNFTNRIQTLAFGMEEYVKLITNQTDTIPLMDHFYQRTYGVGQSTDILLVFDRSKIKDTEWLQFQLDDFGLGVGTNKFRFMTKDLLNEPSIQF